MSATAQVDPSFQARRRATFSTMTARAADEDPVLAALASAPFGPPLTPEQQADLEAALADSRPGVPHEEIAATIERMRLEQAE